MPGTSETAAYDASEPLHALRESLADCSRCGLCSGRTQVVFGVGDPNARLMFVGEGPGFHEDRQGEPFVGAAGKLLTELLGKIGLSRNDVYIANVVKCRPPENRDPLPDEIEACSPHLLEQIAIIRPEIICTLGRFATKLLADTELSMTAIHGKAKRRDLGGVDLVVFPVFHPAAALYNPANRQVLDQDFAKLRHLLAHGLGAREEQAGQVIAMKVPEEVPASGDDVPTRVTVSSQDAPRRPGPENPPADRQEQLPLW